MHQKPYKIGSKYRKSLFFVCFFVHNDVHINFYTHSPLPLHRRILTVHLVPGLNINEESDLLDVVEQIMQDIQQMSEVGWLLRQEQEYYTQTQGQLKPWQQEHLIEQSLVGVPSLFDMFSLTSTTKKYHPPSSFQESSPSSSSSSSSSKSTSTKNEKKKNDRLEFWDSALANGLESTHACASLFTTLYIQTRLTSPSPSSSSTSTLYDVFDIVLNPNDGPPSTDYESSSSNVHCVLSLLVGLSVHTRIMSVTSNLPEYHGWSVANTLENNSEL